MKNSAAGFLALSVAMLTPCTAVADDAESTRIVDAFVTLCPAVSNFDDLERALNDAAAAGRVTLDPERQLTIMSHQTLSMRQRVVWDNQELELGWGAGPACGIVRVWTSDYSAFSDTLSERMGVTWEARDLFLSVRGQSGIVEQHGRPFEVSSILEAHPEGATQGFVTVGIGPAAEATP